jgi:hypothetical protein
LADSSAAGRQTWEQAEMLAADRQAGGRKIGWRQAGRQIASRQTRRLALAGSQAVGRLAGGMQYCRFAAAGILAGGRRTGHRNTCWRHADRVAAGRKAMCRQIVRLVTLWNVLTSILKTISAQIESSEFHIIEFEKYLFVYFVTESF